MPRFVRLVACCLVVCAGTTLAQQTSAPGGAVVGLNYSEPSLAFQVAPGQVVSLMVYGLDYRVTQPVQASGPSLPYSLAGFSVIFRGPVFPPQFPEPPNVPVPMLGIEQTACLTASIGPCATLTNIVIQVPYESLPDCIVCLGPPSARYFLISDNGQVKATVAVDVPGDQIHVITSQDSTFQPFQSPTQLILWSKAIFHGDGTPVDSATAGEELVAYAFGLGLTDPSVKTGQKTPASGVSFDPTKPLDDYGIKLYLDFRPNAPPSRPPVMAPNSALVAAKYIGLVGGSVGLYQVNFTVPPVPAGTPPCNHGDIQSNLTVNLVGTWSFDGGGICVSPR
jgi:hypothetical protein